MRDHLALPHRRRCRRLLRRSSTYRRRRGGSRARPAAFVFPVDGKGLIVVRFRVVFFVLVCAVESLQRVVEL